MKGIAEDLRGLLVIRRSGASTRSQLSVLLPVRPLKVPGRSVRGCCGGGACRKGLRSSSQHTPCHTMGLARGWLPPPFDPPAHRAPLEVAHGGAAPFPPCRCGVMPERRTARRHRPRIGGRVRHRVVAEAKAYPDGVSTSNVLPVMAFEPSVGGPF